MPVPVENFPAQQSVIQCARVKMNAHVPHKSGQFFPAIVNAINIDQARSLSRDAIKHRENESESRSSKRFAQFYNSPLENLCFKARVS